MGMTEFLGGEYDGDFPRPGRLQVKPVTGPLQINVTQTVKVEEIENASDHEVKMAEFAARAVRYFGEQFREVQWHTLQFTVDRVGLEGPETYRWHWSVWAN